MGKKASSRAEKFLHTRIAYEMLTIFNIAAWVPEAWRGAHAECVPNFVTKSECPSMYQHRPTISSHLYNAL
jgi:hypothetical protein